MDLGLSGRHALVCAASKGLGKACAFSLAREGVNVTIVARTEAVLEATAAEIKELRRPRLLPFPQTLRQKAGGGLRWRLVRIPTFWSTTRAGRRREISGNGAATNGYQHSTRTC